MTDLCLKCCLTIMGKGQSLKFKASLLHEIFPISETGRSCNSVFKLVDSSWVIIMEQKRNRLTVGHLFLEPVRVSAGIELYL